MLCAILAVLTSRRQYDVALAALVAAGAYVKPGDDLALTVAGVVPAQPATGHVYRYAILLMFPRAEGQASQTHGFDDSVVLISMGRLFLG